MQVRQCLSILAAAAAVTLAAAIPAVAQTPGNNLPTVETPKGGTVTQVFVSGGNRSLFKIALPPILGAQDVSTSVVETASRDFTLSSLFQVLDPQSFVANVGAEGTGIDPASWRNVGAEGVVKGSAMTRAGGGSHLELRLYV